MSNPDSESPSPDDAASSPLRLSGPFRNWLKGLRKKQGDALIREKIEELIEENPIAEGNPHAESERQLITNILKLRDLRVSDVMIPRADIVAVESSMKLPDLVTFMTREGHSRLPVYREELDDVLGMIHIKDVLPHACHPESFSLQQVVRDVIIVAPSMPVLDLLVEMRQSRRHLALVVDEFGGIDGLVTIEDLVEEIVGEIEDEHDESGPPQLAIKPDGSLMADGRLPLDELEARTGRLLDDASRENVDTLGGLLFFIAGRVPGRGELIRHDSGIEFEVVEADSRRVKRVRIRSLPKTPGQAA